MDVRILWTRQAREDLREIRAFIARDAPVTALAFVSRIKASVERLRAFPHSGQIVREIGREDIREVIRSHYRIIYRTSDQRIDILTVFHSSRLLNETDF